MESRHHYPFADKDMEYIMGNLLRYGVIVSAAIVLTGGIIYLYQHGTETPHYKVFSGEPNRLTDIQKIWQTALQGRGKSVIQLGILVLIATPIARILFSVIGFIVEKDMLYLVITLLVLFIIIMSLF